MNGRILSKNVLGELLQRHFGAVDRKKAEILVHMVIHCGSGAISEVLADRAAELFCQQPRIFVEVLEQTREWKDVVSQMALIRDISQGIGSLGNSPFEKQMKAYAEELGIEKRRQAREETLRSR